MTAKEKFEKIVVLIEQEIKQSHKSASVISDEIAYKLGMSTRDLSTVFSFLLGKSIGSYIKERRMMTAYEYILSSEKYDAQKAVELSGLGDQSAFNKSFKERFGRTPTEVIEKPDNTLLKVKLSWNQLSQDEIIVKSPKKTDNFIKKSIIFGLERLKFEEIKEIIELQEIYEFDELQSEIAYYIYKTYDIPLKDTFRYVNEYHYNENQDDLFNEIEVWSREHFNLSADFVFAEDEDVERLSREEYYDTFAKGNADNPEIRYVYFQGDMASISVVYRVIDKLHEAGEKDVTKVDIDVINICAYNEIDVGYCKRAVAYFKEFATEEHGEDAFEEFIESILRNVPIETAFNSLINLDFKDEFNNCYTFYNAEMDEYELAMEKWASEEMDYSNYEGLDDFYDPDNPED